MRVHLRLPLPCVDMPSAKLVHGHPNSLANRGVFFKRAAYSISGIRVSCTDLEHKLLRCKAKPGHPLYGLRLRQFDPRIHFVLNCGARSCPPVCPLAASSDTEIESAIVNATTSFIDASVRITVHNGDGVKRSCGRGRTGVSAVELSRLFKWFRTDFTRGRGQDAILLQWICEQAAQGKQDELRVVLLAMTQGHKAKLRFDSYDWADNGDWNLPPDDRLMAFYDVAFKLNE
jgi:Protein of unknown function, DUF547